MDIFTDFDAEYTADYYSALHNGNENFDIVNGEMAADDNSSNVYEIETDGENYIAVQGNAEDILAFSDPLKHIQNLKLDSFDF